MGRTRLHVSDVSGSVGQSALDRALAGAEMDDEPLTEKERCDIEASREWFRHNKGIPFEEVVADLGLTMEEVVNYKEGS